MVFKLENKRAILKKFLLLGFLSLFLTGCSKKVFEPIYTTIPTIESIPTITFIDSIKIPSQEKKELTINLFAEKAPIKEEYINKPGAKIKQGKPPSILIAIPQDVIVSGKNQKKFQVNTDFGAEDYINQAEQTIEHALLRHGFNVLDRSKFEAKLRDIRDKANIKPWYWNDWTAKLLESGEYAVVKQEYQNQFEEGTITGLQLTEVVNVIEKYKIGGASTKKRENDEMNDIAEMIRAAQIGFDRADYLLQINEVSIYQAGEKEILIKDLPEVKQFLEDNKGLEFGTTSNTLPFSVTTSWLKTTFNAKLIEIQTGSIVWIGSHEIESNNADKTIITFKVDKSIANDADVNGRIGAHNKELILLNKELKSIEKELYSSYLEASRKRKFESSNEMNSFKKRLVFRIQNLEDSYLSTTNSLIKKLNNPPKIAKEPWKFSYNISLPTSIPDLAFDNMLSAKSKQRLLEHKKKLIKTVTKSLINTINILKE